MLAQRDDPALGESAGCKGVWSWVPSVISCGLDNLIFYSVVKGGLSCFFCQWVNIMNKANDKETVKDITFNIEDDFLVLSYVLDTGFKSLLF